MNMVNKKEMEEKNVMPLLHITKGYDFTVRTKDGKVLANKTVKCKCTPYEKDYFYRDDEYPEFLMKTDENGCINLALYDYYPSNLKVEFDGDDEIDGFVAEYTFDKEDLLNQIDIREAELRKKAEEERKAQEKKAAEEAKKKEQIRLRKEQKLAWEKKQAEFKANEPENIAIELEGISINFKITNDKIDNLKEYIIRTIKRNKGETRVLHALKDVSFKVHKGEKIGLIGYNGAGKSTLLKIISGVYESDEGTMTINGNIAPLLALGAGFDKNYSGRENIFLNGAILGYNEEFLRGKYDEILEFSELGDFINLPVKNYSAGMKAKLGFSVATLVDPDILIIDEVLGVGDITFKKKSRAKLDELMESGTTVILVSHSINEIRSICDTAIWINEGEVKDYGEVNEICDKYVEDAQNASKAKVKKQRLR